MTNPLPSPKRARSGTKRLPSLARGLAAIASACVLAATHASGEELRLGVNTQYVFNSNFFATPNNEDPANSFEFGPTIEISDPDGRFRYEVGYEGAYQAYVDQSGANAWENRLRARASYDIDTRTTIRVTERFRDISNLRFSRQDIALAATALDPNQDRYLRNDIEIELIRGLSRTLELRVSAAHHWIDFEQNIDRSDSDAFEVGSELRYTLTDRHFLGVGGSYIHQDFEEAFSRFGSKGDYLETYLTWIWDITDQVQFVARGGPSWVRSDEDETDQFKQRQLVGARQSGDLRVADVRSCNVDPRLGLPVASRCDFNTPGFPGIAADSLGPFESFPLAIGQQVGTDSAVTFFGGLSLTANLSDWNLTTTYSRRQSTSTGEGQVSSVDRVSLEVEWAPRRLRSSVFVAGSFDRRESLTDSTRIDFTVIDGGGFQAERDVAFTQINNSQNRRDFYTAIVGYRSRFNPNSNGTLEFRYRRSEGRDDRAGVPGADVFFVLYTIEYGLDPIRF